MVYLHLHVHKWQSVYSITICDVIDLGLIMYIYFSLYIHKIFRPRDLIQHNTMQVTQDSHYIHVVHSLCVIPYTWSPLSKISCQTMYCLFRLAIKSSRLHGKRICSEDTVSNCTTDLIVEGVGHFKTTPTRWPVVYGSGANTNSLWNSLPSSQNHTIIHTTFMPGS